MWTLDFSEDKVFFGHVDRLWAKRIWIFPQSVMKHNQNKDLKGFQVILQQLMKVMEESFFLKMNYIHKENKDGKLFNIIQCSKRKK